MDIPTRDDKLEKVPHLFEHLDADELDKISQLKMKTDHAPLSKFSLIVNAADVCCLGRSVTTVHQARECVSAPHEQKEHPNLHRSTNDQRRTSQRE